MSESDIQWEQLPDDYEEIGNVMSNFDHLIHQDITEKLKTGKFHSAYPAWDFCGRVWYVDPVWKCRIMIHGQHVATLTADTLDEIMSEASERWGAE